MNGSYPTRSRRTILKTAGGLTVASSLAGCTGGGDDSSGPIKLGVLAAEDFAPSYAILQGAEVAVEQLNENGGVLGRDVEIVHRDTQVDPQTTRNAYQDLTVGEGVPVTFGIMSSEGLLSIMDTMAQQQSLMLNTGSATPESSQNVADNYEQYKYYFRVGILSASQYGESLVDFATYGNENWGWETVAVVAEDAAWSSAAFDSIQPVIEDSPLEGVNFQMVGTEVEDFTPTFDEVEESGADLLIPLASYNAARMSVQWSNQERQFAFGGIANELAPATAYDNLDGDCRYAGVYATTHPDVNPTDKTEPFVQAYNDMFDSNPGNFAYSTFDAMKLWAWAAGEADSTNPDDLVPVIEDASYTGVMGTHEFKDNHDIVYDKEQLPQPIFQWQEQDGSGNQALVYPEEYANGEWTKPSWL